MAVSSEAWTGMRGLVGRVAGYTPHEARRFISTSSRFDMLEDWDSADSEHLLGDLSQILLADVDVPESTETVEQYIVRVLKACAVSEPEFAQLAAHYLTATGWQDQFLE